MDKCFQRMFQKLLHIQIGLHPVLQYSPFSFSSCVKLALKFDYWPSSSALKYHNENCSIPPVSQAYDIYKSNDKKELIDSFLHNLNISGDRDNLETTNNRKSRLPIFVLIAQEKE